MADTLDSTVSDGGAPQRDDAGAADQAQKAEKAPKKRGGGLNSMLLADLKAMAGGMGIPGAGSMKKAQLVDAIKAAQAGPRSETAAEQPRREQRQPDQPKQDRPKDQAKQDQPKQDQPKQDQAGQGRDAGEQPTQDQPRRNQGEQPKQGGQGRQRNQDQGGQEKRGQDQRGQDQRGQDQAAQDKQGKAQQDKPQDRQQDKPQAQQDKPQDDHDDQDGEGGSRRNRRRRGRDRDRDRGPRATREPDTEVREDDVLVPAAGILDVLDNYAFVRTSGYLAGPDDVYLSLSLVRKYGLRRGDAIAGQVRQPREGERREKFNPMVRIDSVNGVDPEQAKNRVDFAKLTPVHPAERLRMETAPEDLTGRVLDIAAPIGKGQRTLVVAPAKSGKTMLLQAMAAAVTANNPECHLMVVLVDERPEEVTEFERSVKGEVIASTFDRPASDHTTVAELAIERAKRLVELGHDVVVLLDGLTRLGRAYNLSTPASGRILSGGVDSSALYPPKRFFGAARNIENGGSLTIVATALVESGSRMDEVIFEEFGGTANAEIRLRSDFAAKRLYPAIDVVASGTRREEVLVGPQEQQVLDKLRRRFGGNVSAEEHTTLLHDLGRTGTNYEFLVQVQKS